MSNNAKTLQEIYAGLNHSEIANQAEDNFRASEMKRRRLSQKIANAIPVFTLIVLLVTFILSSPHTATLFMRITPEIDIVFFTWSISLTWLIGNVSAIGIEGAVLLIAALQEYGIKGRFWTLLMGLILVLSISVNVVGGLIVLDEFFAIGTYSRFELAWQIVSVFAGFIVSLVSYATGKILVMFATDKITLEIETGKQWHGVIKYYALKEAFYNAALKFGATPTRASSYAETQAKSFCNGEIGQDETGQVYAVSNIIMNASGGTVGASAHHGQNNNPVHAVRSSLAVPRDFGFGGMANRSLGVADVQDTMDSKQSPDCPITNMTKKNLHEWLDENADSWKSFSIGKTKRDRAESISMALTGNASGYKTVERVFSERGIEL